ncbi:MAG: TIGR01777 family oxidoreductase [Planctomycetota bacterium]
MNVLISGATGLVGRSLTQALEDEGHQVIRLLRPSSKSGGSSRTVTWDPIAGTVDEEALRASEVDAVVHLAGEGIADGRWNEARKKRIRNRRVDGTRVLAEAVSRLESPPSVFVCASAIGYYGNRGDELLNEDSPPGGGFLPDVCRDWEGATVSLDETETRVVHVRIGIILSKDGGALQKMLLPFKMGVGGKVGDGKQYMSWISIDDMVRVLVTAIENAELEGPVNAVAPNPVTNLEFTKSLGKALSRPTVFPMPAFAARLAFGELANDLLLGSLRVDCARLRDVGFEFQQPGLDGALREVLQRKRM